MHSAEEEVPLRGVSSPEGTYLLCASRTRELFGLQNLSSAAGHSSPTSNAGYCSSFLGGVARSYVHDRAGPLLKLELRFRRAEIPPQCDPYQCGMPSVHPHPHLELPQALVMLTRALPAPGTLSPSLLSTSLAALTSAPLSPLSQYEASLSAENGEGGRWCHSTVAMVIVSQYCCSYLSPLSQ